MHIFISVYLWVIYRRKPFDKRRKLYFRFVEKRPSGEKAEHSVSLYFRQQKPKK